MYSVPWFLLFIQSSWCHLKEGAELLWQRIQSRDQTFTLKSAAAAPPKHPSAEHLLGMSPRSFRGDLCTQAAARRYLPRWEITGQLPMLRSVGTRSWSLQIAMKSSRQFSKMWAQIWQAPRTSHLASQGVGPSDKGSADHLHLSPNPFLNSNTAFKRVGIYTATSTCKFCIVLYSSWKAWLGMMDTRDEKQANHMCGEVPQ